MHRISKWIVRGVVSALPVLVVLYLIYWAESLLGGVLRSVLGDKWYVPGMGLAAALVLFIVIGITMHAWISRLFLRVMGGILSRIPLVKTLYGSIRDMMGFVAGEGHAFSRVVLVRVPNTDFRFVGLVTREEFPPDGPLKAEGMVAVYLPWSYNMGGNLILVPKTSLEPTTMSAEAALMFNMTAGVTLGVPAKHPAHKPAALADQGTKPVS